MLIKSEGLKIIYLHALINACCLLQILSKIECLKMIKSGMMLDTLPLDIFQSRTANIRRQEDMAMMPLMISLADNISHLFALKA